MKYGIILNADRVLLNLNKTPPFPPLSAFENYQKNDFIHIDELNKENFYLNTHNVFKMIPSNFNYFSVKHLLSTLPIKYLQLIFKARHYQCYQQNELYCSYCGEITQRLKLNEKYCSYCDKTHYPKISPCIITLITRKNEALLVQHKNIPNRKFSCIAGFIEPGENAEEALVREIKEEVGLTVEQPKYFGSQIWPFPNQLMLGFITQYLDGAVRCCEKEIEQAKWFKKNNLPDALPHPFSIARKMINSFFN